MTAHVTMLPRYCGDSTPSAASTTTITMVHTTCDYASRTLATPTPTPTSDANMSLFCGGRNTSPWISFQPPSSTVSSRSSSLYVSARTAGRTMELYLEMSRESVRRMIIPTRVYLRPRVPIPTERNRAMKRLLVSENQCTPCLLFPFR